MINKIKELRAKHNLTQEKLAYEIGLSRQSLSLIENGDSVPNGDTMIKISRYFKMPCEEIFFLNGGKHE